MMLMTMLLQGHISHFTSAFKSEKGQDFAEYALILAVVVLVAVVGFGLMGQAISDIANTVTADLNGLLP